MPGWMFIVQSQEHVNLPPSQQAFVLTSQYSLLRGEATNVFILGLTQLVIEPMIYHTSDEQANHYTIGHISQFRPTHGLCYLAKNRSIHASIKFTYKKSMKELFRNRKSKKNRHKMTKRIKDKS
jgi:hypothetical protein